MQNEIPSAEAKGATGKGALTLLEVSTLVGLSPRYVKHLIQRGLVSRPDGATRAARYSKRHVGELLEVQRLKGAGWSIAQIAARNAASSGATKESSAHMSGLEPTVQRRYALSPGVELVISESAQDEDLIVARCMEAIQALSPRSTP